MTASAHEPASKRRHLNRWPSPTAAGDRRERPASAPRPRWIVASALNRPALLRLSQRPAAWRRRICPHTGRTREIGQACGSPARLVPGEWLTCAAGEPLRRPDTNRARTILSSSIAASETSTSVCRCIGKLRERGVIASAAVRFMPRAWSAGRERPPRDHPNASLTPAWRRRDGCGYRTDAGGKQADRAGRQGCRRLISNARRLRVDIAETCAFHPSRRLENCRRSATWLAIGAGDTSWERMPRSRLSGRNRGSGYRNSSSNASRTVPLASSRSLKSRTLPLCWISVFQYCRASSRTKGDQLAAPVLLSAARLVTRGLQRTWRQPRRQGFAQRRTRLLPVISRRSTRPPITGSAALAIPKPSHPKAMRTTLPTAGWDARSIPTGSSGEQPATRAVLAPEPWPSREPLAAFSQG